MIHFAQCITATRGRKVDCLASYTDQTYCSISSILRGWAEREGSVTQRVLCLPIRSTSECKTRGEERWHCGPRVALQRCGQRQAWQAGAGRWTRLSLWAHLC